MITTIGIEMATQHVEYDQFNLINLMIIIIGMDMAMQEYRGPADINFR